MRGFRSAGKNKKTVRIRTSNNQKQEGQYIKNNKQHQHQEFEKD